MNMKTPITSTIKPQVDAMLAAIKDYLQWLPEQVASCENLQQCGQIAQIVDQLVNTQTILKERYDVSEATVDAYCQRIRVYGVIEDDLDLPDHIQLKTDELYASLKKLKDHVQHELLESEKEKLRNELKRRIATF